jgi:LuxR family glucitol operon transcriptional activator
MPKRRKNATSVRGNIEKLTQINKVEGNVIIHSTSTSQGAQALKQRSKFVAIPPRTYLRFLGRSEELEFVTSALRDRQHKPVIAIIGLGGIGKTALAREVLDRFHKEKYFAHVVWVSAKIEQFIGESIVKIKSSSYDFEQLLSDIGRQCGRDDIVKAHKEQKQEYVKYLLSEKTTLIIVDNLETINEGDKLIDDIIGILGKSKLLVTSRNRVKHSQVFSVELGGFPKEDSVMFIREEGKERGIQAVAKANRESLIKIHQVTGGAPLAMKLVIGQISRQPLNMVLDSLIKASIKEQNYEFYRFVYQHSWKILDVNARRVLVDLSVFPSITGGTLSDVRAVSKIDEPANFLSAIDQLVSMSLVDKNGSVGRERYGLHPLTQYFVKSDITKEWGAT